MDGPLCVEEFMKSKLLFMDECWGWIVGGHILKKEALSSRGRVGLPLPFRAAKSAKNDLETK